MPWASRGMVQGGSDLCQGVALVISQLGTGKLAGDPLLLTNRANQGATNLYVTLLTVHSKGAVSHWLDTCHIRIVIFSCVHRIYSFIRYIHKIYMYRILEK